MVTTIRPKDEPAATSVAAGDIFLIDGTTGVRGLAATVPVLRDGNANVAVNNSILGYATTATAAGTTTLTATSPWAQYFTGVTTQIVALPVVSTLALDHSFYVQNSSTGALTINSSGGNLVATIAAGTSALISCILITGTSAAPWSTKYHAALVASGKVLTVSNSLTLAGTDGTTQTFPSTSGTVVTSVSVNAVTNAMATQMGAATLKGNPTAALANASDFTIQGLTNLAAPHATLDFIPIYDHVSGTIKSATPSSVGSAGSVASIAGNTGAFTLSRGITNVGNDIRLALNNATLQASPSNPASTASGGVMMGLGATCTLTPVYSTRIYLAIQGDTAATLAGNQTSFMARYGTGTAPVNGAAGTGTTIGSNIRAVMGANNAFVPFNVGGVITGLTPGTAYWFDIFLGVSAGNGAVENISCLAYEF